MPNQATATARALEFDFVSRLARFFPESAPVRIPIRLSCAYECENDQTTKAPCVHCGDKQRNSSAESQGFTWRPLQDTIIEFATPQEVLFILAQPLEFADLVLLESKDGALRAEASIVAVQYHPERTVVAARFLKPVPNWIVKS